MANPSDKNDKQMNRFLLLFVTVLLAWNIYLQVQQSEHSKQIKVLFHSHTKLKSSFQEISSSADIHRFKRDLGAVEDDDEEDDFTENLEEYGGLTNDLFSDSISSQNTAESLFPLLRSRRDASGGLPVGQAAHSPRRSRTARKNKKEKTKKKSSSSSSGAHFVAHVDEERMNRERAEGIEPEIGVYSSGGSLEPRDQIYRFWKPEEWTDHKVFNFSQDTGKVMIQQKGYYLVYAQIVFHGPSARKSYGIHINDELVPYVEAMAFDNIHSRSKRNLQMPSNNTSDAAELSRHRRHQQYSSYSQCNTVAVAHLKKGDHIFIRAMEQKRPVIAKSYLTFWGVAKL